RRPDRRADAAALRRDRRHPVRARPRHPGLDGRGLARLAGSRAVVDEGRRSYRPVIMGPRRARASHHPLATHAGPLVPQPGRRPWASLFDAAVHYARDGFGATRAYRRFAGEQQAVLAADRRSARTLLPDGAPPRLGGPIVQPDLARTLERLAAEGAESFHRG